MQIPFSFNIRCSEERVMRRVVITGLGLVTSLGNSMEKTWKKLLAGETGVGMIEGFDTTDMPVKIAGEKRG